MAMLERTLRGDFKKIVERLHQGVLDGSISASYEDGTEFTMGSVRCAVRMYERYSWSGSNRVALSLTVVGNGEQVHVTAITAGGSQAMFFKVNTWGEDAFLDTLAQVMDRMEECR